MQGLLLSVGGFSMFLMGIRLLSESMRVLRQPGLIRADVCGGFLAGLGWTAAAQSSSAVTACLLSLAQAGIYSPGDCFPILLGANVGTTVTVWLFSGLRAISLKGAPLIPMVAALALKKRMQAANACMGLSLVLLGMEYMAEAAAVPELFARSLHTVPSALLGTAAATALLQSSAVTVGLLQRAAGLTMQTAAAAVLGANIGTTATGLLASLFLGEAGRKTAALETAINLISAAMLLPLIPLLPKTAPDAAQIAAIHTLCNAIPAALLLPFSGIVKKLPACGGRQGQVFIPEGAAGRQGR